MNLHQSAVLAVAEDVPRVLIETAVDAVVVDDDDDDGQLVAQHRFDLHAAETDGRISLPTHNRQLVFFYIWSVELIPSTNPRRHYESR